jgi:Holliday junction resolvasome RuvABC endonuclease subunit
MNKPLIILTNDPSMTAWGWAVVKDDEVLDCCCIKTIPEHKKLRTRVADDRIRRANEIVTALRKIIKQYNVNFIISELPHGSQNAQAAVMIGMVAGIIVAVAECMDIPFEGYSEQDAKKAVLSKRSATKEDMIDAISALYDIDWTETKYVDEAVADAMAIYHVFKQQSVSYKMLK